MKKILFCNVFRSLQVIIWKIIHICVFSVLLGRTVSFIFWHGIAITYAKSIKEKTSGAERVKERAIERGWWVQPVSVSPPSDLARRQNGLTDSCHRKRVSLTRNLDEESSKVVKSKNPLFYTESRSPGNQAAKKTRLFVGVPLVQKNLWCTSVSVGTC